MPGLTNADLVLGGAPTEALEVPPLRHAAASVGQLAYDTLRNAIVAMDVYDREADLRLDEKRLAADLGVSRTPVREALARLEHEGLVTIRPRRGIYLVRKTKAQIVEMIVAWAAMEAAAARLACGRAGDDDIASLRTLLLTPEGGERPSHLDEYSNANLRFHARVVLLGHSPLIINMADGLLVHVRALRPRTIGGDGAVERPMVDHLHIVEALEARDADLAGRLVREHALALARRVERTVTHLD
jgi:DNA-binding GntR family transcriptional regulator